ncbi:DUF1579 domain-containing protein [Phenylobacterium sp.]|uniref:DUF1579 domain-containing protein n=1 Tax=Phenylobacterium sp. TaxID=1871053 RepID=UPI001228CC19|nr:DUF1579 domain-containing protein [Phenylobacterium sp.]THD57375.1 MAG: hypothetical protein E8A12_13495 [Phenylobacterium sp.]
MNAIAIVKDGRHDFDFFYGQWAVQHRLLKRRGVHCEDWLEFFGTAQCRGLMGGLCNVEENDMPARRSQGVAFRSFDIARRTWSIHWVSSTDGLVGEPVHGRFEGGEGRFYGVDLDDGRPVKVAFHWSHSHDRAARWSQAFSYDEGRTWEVNWVMEFTRVGS